MRRKEHAEEMEKSAVRNLDSSFGINVCKEFQDVKSSGRGSVETLLRMNYFNTQTLQGEIYHNY